MSAPNAAPGACPHCGTPLTADTRFCTHCGTAIEARSSAARPGPTSATAPRRGPASSARPRALRGDRSDLIYVLIAALLAVVVSDLPFVNMVIYPFRLFETFVHEWSHAMIAVITGGTVVKLQINPNDLSGETWTAGGWQLFIYSAGYIGAAVAGAVLLLLPTRFANRTLIGLGLVAGLMPILAFSFFHTAFPPLTLLWAALFSVCTVVVGMRAAPRAARIFQQFVAVVICLKAIDDLRTLAWYSSNAPRQFTDALGASNLTGLPELFWTILWGAVALAAIGFSLVRVVRRSLA